MKRRIFYLLLIFYLTFIDSSEVSVSEVQGSYWDTLSVSSKISKSDTSSADSSSSYPKGHYALYPDEDAAAWYDLERQVQRQSSNVDKSLTTSL